MRKLYCIKYIVRLIVVKGNYFQNYKNDLKVSCSPFVDMKLKLDADDILNSATCRYIKVFKEYYILLNITDEIKKKFVKNF